MKKLSKIEIIEDTVNFYSENPTERRCLDENNNCLYNFEGNHCAVGRYMKDCYKNSGNNFYLETDASYLIKDIGDKNLFIEEVQGHSVKFWEKLQKLHDRKSNWWEHGLTEMGEERVKELKEEFLDEDI